MMNKFLDSIFIISCVIYGSYLPAEGTIKEELLQVSIIYRHGERAPVITFPTYGYVYSNWKNGPGNLSDRGMDQMRRLGQDLAQRYLASSSIASKWVCGKRFIPKPNVNLFSFASKSTRSRMGASIFTKEFVDPPSNSLTEQHDGRVSNKSVIIRFPDPGTPDIFLLGAVKCKTLVDFALNQEFKNDPALAHFITSNAPFFRFLYQKTGFEPSTSKISIFPIADTLLTDRLAGNRLPTWANRKVFERVQDMALYIYRHLGRHNEFIMKRSVGLLANNILDVMRATAEAYRQKQRSHHSEYCTAQLGTGPLEAQPPSITMYAGHIYTILPMMHTLNLDVTEAPGYGATLILELWASHLSQQSSAEAKFKVKIAYKNDVDDELRYLSQGWDLGQLRANLTNRLASNEAEMIRYCESGPDVLPFKIDQYH